VADELRDSDAEQIRLERPALRGEIGPPPSWFTKTVVIPWVSIGAEAASAPLRASARPAWEWPSMNPGAA